jgi:hypothetical protein
MQLYVNRRFGGIYYLHLHDRKLAELETRVQQVCRQVGTRWFLARLILDPDDGGDTLL